jgi:hypothetical protein
MGNSTEEHSPKLYVRHVCLPVCLSVSLSVCPSLEQLGSLWKDFHEILCRGVY